MITIKTQFYIQYSSYSNLKVSYIWKKHLRIKFIQFKLCFNCSMKTLITMRPTRFWNKKTRVRLKLWFLIVQWTWNDGTQKLFCVHNPIPLDYFHAIGRTIPFIRATSNFNKMEWMASSNFTVLWVSLYLNFLKTFKIKLYDCVRRSEEVQPYCTVLYCTVG